MMLSLPRRGDQDSNTTWHLIQGAFHWDAMARDLRPVYTAVNEAQAKERLAEFHDTWGEQYPAIKGLWDNAWTEFVPFLDYSGMAA